MTIIGWLQIALVLALILLAGLGMGAWMARVLEGSFIARHPVLGRIERGVYRVSGVDASRQMAWREYVAALMTLNALHFLILYAMLRLQDVLPWNPQGAAGMSPRLAFNTAISFVTNTNWQAYAGEQAASNFVQMFGLTSHMFVSAATGIAAALAVARGFARRGTGELGNFWVDMTRIALFVLLPAAIVVGLALVASGVPQTMAAYPAYATLEGAKQTLALGPVAFMEAIKELGTNGGGFFNANSAHPFENPSAWSNIIEMVAIQAIPIGLLFTFGRIVGDVRQGRALACAVGVLLLAFTAIAYWAESRGNPLLTALGVDPSMGNMEGKELRFGTAMSTLFTVVTTATSCGAVNAMFDSLMPLTGLVAMFQIQLGEVSPGGVGSGLYGLLVFALIAVFVAGLMVGRTPEYLGKKIQAREVKLAMLAVLILPLCILGGAALTVVLPTGLASMANAGPHGLSEMLYAFTSATGNNGSAFGGITADTPWLDTTLGLAMLLGRFAFMVPVLAIAGSLAAKPKLPPSTGTFPTTGPLFVGLMVGVIVIMGGLQFLPALSLGPIAEHFAMLAGQTF